MKATPLLLAASLVANAALVIAFVAGVSSDSVPVATAATEHSLAASASTVSGRADSAAIDAGIDPALWNKLPANDWPGLVASLRAKGFPPSVVRAIVAAQVGESFRDRQKALQATAGTTPFWKNTTYDAKTQAAMRELSREQQKILKDLLGNDATSDSPLMAIQEERRYGSLPAAKRDQIKQITDDFNDQRNAIYDRARGGNSNSINLLPADGEALNRLERTQRAEIARLLTPQELEDYELRNSNAASSIRSRLTTFNATEAEFRTLYQIQAAFDNQWGQQYTNLSQEEMRARSSAQEALQKQFEAALGPERFVEFQRANDYYYQQTSKLVARLELPPETANQLYALQQEVQKQRPTGPNQVAQLTAIAEETNAKVSALLGPRGLEAYKTNGGQWLQNIAPRPASPQPATGGRGGGG